MHRFRSFLLVSAVAALGACEGHSVAPTAPFATARKQASNATVTNAVYTIVNDSADGPGTCANGGTTPQNCNIYAAKENVWLGGESVHGPKGLANGSYFFAVLKPGSQGDPNDGSPDILSDVAPTTNTGAGDSYQNRTFTLSGGVINYTGTHAFGSNKIRLFPYDDTPNPGGEYIMAVCSLKSGYPVSPDDCKYDAFRVSVAEAPSPALPPTALTVSDPAASSYDRSFSWTITKSVDQPLVKSATGAVTVSYTVTATRNDGTASNIHVSGGITLTNTNDGPVVLTSLTDALSNGTPCTIDNAPAALAVGETHLTYSCALAALPTSPLSNIVTMTWAAQDVNGHALEGGTATTQVDGITFAVHTIDSSVTVTDTFGDLGVAEGTKTFTYTKTLENGVPGTCKTIDNTASFSTSETHITGSASQPVTICVGAPLTASASASQSYTRAYAWNVSKAVDKTVVKQVGGSATFNYTVNAAQTGSTDSNWLVTGTLTVNNPNTWEAVTADLADAIDNGGSCAIAGGSSVTIPASGSVTRSYSCSYASVPSAAAYTNVVSVSWDAAAAATSTGGTVTSATGAFGAPTTLLNNSATIRDNFNGTVSLLGTLTASDATPTTATYTYAKILPVVANVCSSYNNTASYSGNSGANGSASQSVMVCGNVAGGLTMGFWQNKNGQAIITGGAATSNVCNAGSWLRGFAPFQDLSATASCAQLATYVTNIIKAANASGAAMNAMLKGQMLATALDVYFSDASLGGNKTAAAMAMSGIKVDLAKVCSSITSCSSTYANVSGGFGGATSMTVGQILAFVASQSNAGGSSWYGQVKTTQEFAKNAFDAINNAVALVAP